MARSSAITALAILILAVGLAHAGGEKAKDLNIQGTFNDKDPRDAQRGGPSQTHIVKLKAGQAYVIDMISKDLDSYLRLLDPKDNQLDEDDDSGGMLNSRIRFNCPKDGDYKIVCTTFAANMSGSYTLTMKIGPPLPKQVSAHALLLDKAAPDFKADFAVAGQPGKLADFKGKVVLMYFWEVRSSPSLALLPILNGWHKAHKDDGLAVLGVTYYPSDIGQKLGLDKETGKTVTVQQADRQSDRALLAAFAAHHKLEHPLLVLPKEDAVTAFDAYAVNGLPQMVVIDRKGMIRKIDLGGAASGEVENEIKKLLAEK